MRFAVSNFSEYVTFHIHLDTQGGAIRMLTERDRESRLLPAKRRENSICWAICSSFGLPCVSEEEEEEEDLTFSSPPLPPLLPSLVNATNKRRRPLDWVCMDPGQGIARDEARNKGRDVSAV